MLVGDGLLSVSGCEVAYRRKTMAATRRRWPPSRAWTGWLPGGGESRRGDPLHKIRFRAFPIAAPTRNVDVFRRSGRFRSAATRLQSAQRVRPPVPYMTASSMRDDPLARLEEWYGTPLGRELLTEESDCLDRMLRDTFGYYLLQVGIAGQFQDAITASRIRHHILLPASRRPLTLGAQMVASPSHFPVATDSVDVVFLPHVLEFARDARQVLREAERVLIPEGRVIVIGFNALSLWGGWRLIRGGQGRVPWSGNFLTPFRIGDWMSLLGFQIETQEMIMFRPPWRRALLHRLSFLASLGRRYWPLLAGVYVIRGVKRVSTLTPVRPSWQTRRRVLAGGAVEPTARQNGRA
jgi:SAM-dependent methyltransferase